VSDSDQKPRIIKTELGDGTSTVLPYGVSVDVSAATEKLRSQIKRLTPMGVPVGPKPVDNPAPPDPVAPPQKAKAKHDADADADEGDGRPEPPKPPTRQHARRRK
jgi:hypothetical protein